MSSGQMNKMMRRLGIQVKEIPDVQELIVRTSTKQYTFRNVELTVMDSGGSKNYTFTGAATVRDLTADEKSKVAAAAPAAEAEAEAAPETVEEESRSAEEMLADVEIEISDDDIALVASQTGKSPKEAKKVLEETKGDIAEAIVRLTE